MIWRLHDMDAVASRDPDVYQKMRKMSNKTHHCSFRSSLGQWARFRAFGLGCAWVGLWMVIASLFVSLGLQDPQKSDVCNGASRHYWYMSSLFHTLQPYHLRTWEAFVVFSITPIENPSVACQVMIILIDKDWTRSVIRGSATRKMIPLWTAIE